ncbi:MAG: hypothetical protein ACI4NJ_05035 [Cellvibrio sp.]
MKISEQFDNKHNETYQKLKPYVWFVGLWIGGFIAVSALAYGFRYLAGLAYG